MRTPPEVRVIEQSECITDILPSYLHKAHVTILTGPPYMGKSRFALWLTYKAAMGEACFWGQLEPLRVLYCSERSRSLMLTQLVGLGLQLPAETHFRFFTVGDMTPEEHNIFRVNPLKAVMKKAATFRPHIIVLDTLVHFLPTSETKNVNDYGSMADRIMRVQITAFSLQAAILAIHHTAKEKEGQGYSRVLEKSLGSQAIPGGTLSAWNLSPFDMQDPADIKLGFTADTHAYIKPEDVIIRVLPNSPLEWYPMSYYLTENPTKDAEPRGPLQKAILDAITEPITRVDLVKKVCMTSDSHPDNIHKAITKMIERKLLIETPKTDTSEALLNRTPLRVVKNPG